MATRANDLYKRALALSKAASALYSSVVELQSEDMSPASILANMMMLESLEKLVVAGEGDKAELALSTIKKELDKLYRTWYEPMAKFMPPEYKAWLDQWKAALDSTTAADVKKKFGNFEAMQEFIGLAPFRSFIEKRAKKIRKVYNDVVEEIQADKSIAPFFEFNEDDKEQLRLKKVPPSGVLDTSVARKKALRKTQKILTAGK